MGISVISIASDNLIANFLKKYLNREALYEFFSYFFSNSLSELNGTGIMLGEDYLFVLFSLLLKCYSFVAMS